MKKVLTAALSAALAVSMITPVFAADFSDISEDKYAWARPYIEEMADMGFISGYEDGTYRPDNEVTRLEAICLFARAMGSNSAENEEIVAIAMEQYQDVVERYDLNFGEEDVAFMLYRGALRESELDTYLGGTRKSEAMPRYEAAIIITKAMGAEEAATQELMVDLAYTDARDIPSRASQYVYYVTQQGIMSGMEDGTFSPNSSVLRSQIAVMLSKTVDKLGIGFTEGKLTEVDTETMNVQIKDSEGDSYYMGYNADTKMYVEGVLTQPQNVPVNVSAIFTYADGRLLYIDVLSRIADETVEGIFRSYASHSGVLSVMLQVTGESEIQTYECAADVSVMRNNQSATIRDFSQGDYVTLELSGGLVQNIIGEPRESTIRSATIEAMNIASDITITISHANSDYDGKTYAVSDDVRVRKNGDTSDLSQIYRGDVVDLTLEYGVITAITAESNVKTVEGQIKELTISSTPKMTVSVNGTDTTYDIPSGVTITINNEEGSLYDFRVGDTVRLTLDSQAITAISAISAQATSKNMTGVVTAINSSYGFIRISYMNGDVTAEETVYCKDSNTKFISSLGTTMSMKDIKEGDTISVRGAVKNGAYEATLVIVETE